MINAEIGAEGDILEKLKRIPEVRVADEVYGVYDIVVIVEGGNMEEIKNICSTKIRTIKDVRSTLTMIVVQ